MNSFNKLYNLILLSIISLNKLSRTKILAATYADLLDRLPILNFLNDLANKGKILNKAADFLVKFFANGELTDTTDERINQVVDILTRNTSFNTQQNISLADFLKQNLKYINRAESKENSKDIISYIDRNLPQLFDKKKYDNNVVIYLVEDSRDGQAAVRKIVDMQWGEDANPWCLITRYENDDYDEDDEESLEFEMDTAWSNWETYGNYPKHIAFQDGKLLAFCAAAKGNCTWWDRKDEQSPQLKLFDGTFMLTDKYAWTPEKIRERFIKASKVYLDEKTGLYNCDHNLVVRNKDIIDGHFPVKFGVIKGDFWCHSCKALTSLLGAPKKVTGIVNYDGCTGLSEEERIWWKKQKFFINNKLHLNEATGRWDSDGSVTVQAKDLVKGHFPVKFGVINGWFDCSNLKGLKSLDGAPTEVKGDVHYQGCTRLPNYSLLMKEDLINSNKLVYNKETDSYDVPGDIWLRPWHVVNGHLPIKLGVVKGDFAASWVGLTSLLNCPVEVDGDYDIGKNRELKSLVGSPKIVNGDFKCYYCDGLTSLLGAPEEVKGDFDCQGCNSLINLLGGPKKVDGDYRCAYSQELESLQGVAEYIGDSLYCGHCENLTSIDEHIKHVGGTVYRKGLYE